jgi:enoyl-CoA hydratase
MSARVTFSTSEQICIVTLCNEARRNAVTSNMWRQIAEFANGDRQAFGRVVIFRGEGSKAFSAGADVQEFASRRSNVTQARAYDDLVEETCRSVERIPIPTIAVVHGACMGAGASLAASCDIRITSEEAFFAIPAAKIGLGYDPRGLRRLSRVFGLNAARLALFSGARLPASRAYALGAVHMVFSREATEDAALKFAAEVRDNAPLTIMAAKAVFYAMTFGSDENWAEAARLYQAADSSADYEEGRAAFASRRRPVFRGS